MHSAVDLDRIMDFWDRERFQRSGLSRPTSHLGDEAIEAQRGEDACSRSHSSRAFIHQGSSSSH